MSAIQYPFIDIAVHKDVRARFARGEGLVLFSTDMERVLWANGAGATFFGKDSIYDFIEQGPNRQEISFRQLVASAVQLSNLGDRRSLLVRVPSGFRRMPVQAAVEMVQVRKGDTAVLFSVPSEPSFDPAVAAKRLLSGFDDPDTHMAVLDTDGSIIAASDKFDILGITSHTARTLVTLVDGMPERLLKRPIPTSRGYLPAAIGKISDDPAQYLLFTVETILGDMNPNSGYEEIEAATAALPPAISGETDDVASEQPWIDAPSGDAATFEAVVDAIGHIEDIDDGEEQDSGQQDFLPSDETPVEANFYTSDPVDDAAPEHDAENVDAVSTTENAPEPANEETGAWQIATPAAPIEPATDVRTDELVPDTEASEEQHRATEVFQPEQDVAPGGFSFNRANRPLRFVWKIDADGRFCEVSSEFAEAVGPRAADINGLAFGDVSALFNLDPSGKIAELLRKRDTWSGKTIYWPVEGTSLMVPVDLAALPTYSRNRDFDGFRGFGIVRSADAVEDPHATGMTFIEQAAPDAPATEPVMTEEAPGEVPGTSDEPAAVVHDDQALQSDSDAERHDTQTDAPEAATETETWTASDVDQAGGHDEAGGDEDEQDLFEHEDADAAVSSAFTPGFEPPALRIVENDGRRFSDKIIQLEERRARARDGLSPHEQAAFREIARKLDPLGVNDVPSEAPQVEDSVPTPPQPTQEAAVREADDATATASVEEQSASVATRVQADRILSPEVVDILPLALLIHRGDDLIHANPEFLALTAYDSVAALNEAGGLDSLLERQAIEGADGQAGQVVVVRSDDELVPVSARLQSVRWEPDNASALMLALTPLAQPSTRPAAPVAAIPTSDMARELARLKVETEELHSILETATDGVVLLGAEGDIRSMNRSASALFNYDEAETRGKPFVMLFAHESQKAILDYLNGLTDNGVASVLNDGREVIGREASGGFLPLFMTIGRLTSSNGYCAVIRDITQWKRTEEELRSAKRAAETANAHKTDFLARVSHEIRTPLNAIIGFSDMMASEHFGPIGHPRYTEYAGDIGRSGRHVLDIVNDLLDISKIEAGEMDLEFIAVGLNETVASAVSIVQPQANSQRVIIRTALSQAVPHVVADLRSIKQIVLNILANAIRFTPSGGQIIVSTAYEANGSVVLRIRDTGIGMSRSELEQAMKPFRQVATGGRARNDGTGLGLPLTKAMVDANRATFSIHSTPNEGTLVEITFPSPRVLAN